MYIYGYRQHQPHAFVNKLNYYDNRNIVHNFILLQLYFCNCRAFRNSSFFKCKRGDSCGRCRGDHYCNLQVNVDV